MMDRLSKSLLAHLGLETILQKFLRGKLKDGIEIKFLIGKETITRHTTQKCGSFEDTFWVFGVQGEEGTRCLSEFGEGVLHTPDLALASEPVLTNELEFGVKTFLFVRTPRRLICFTDYWFGEMSIVIAEKNSVSYMI